MQSHLHAHALTHYRRAHTQDTHTHRHTHTIRTLAFTPLLPTPHYRYLSQWMCNFEFREMQQSDAQMVLENLILLTHKYCDLWTPGTHSLSLTLSLSLSHTHSKSYWYFFLYFSLRNVTFSFSSHLLVLFPILILLHFLNIF